MSVLTMMHTTDGQSALTDGVTARSAHHDTETGSRTVSDTHTLKHTHTPLLQRRRTALASRHSGPG